MTQKPNQLFTLMYLMVLAIVITTFGLIVKNRSLSREREQLQAQLTLTVYGFSVQEDVMTKAVFPAFEDLWQEQTGQQIDLQGVFTDSEGIAEAILEGAAAQVAIFSNEQHATWLQVNGWIETDWHTFPNQGIVTTSPLVIAVRPGNPLGIQDWVDLTRPGVRLVHPDPRTSGGAQWALLAEYGTALMDEEDGSEAAARDQLSAIWDNVVVTPASSKDAMRAFMFGTGDALITYEQDALLARSRGATLEIMTPRSTIISEHVVVIVDRNVKPWQWEAVDAFVDFLWTWEAQRTLTRYYFRAVSDQALNEVVPEFCEVERPFTVRDLGGWGQAYPEIINGVWQEQILEK